jgi:hypothetical protein
MLSVREMILTDVVPVVNYWHQRNEDFLTSMGVDVSKLPSREQLTQMLSEHLSTPIEQRKSYCIIWELDGKSIGHCNPTRQYLARKRTCIYTYGTEKEENRDLERHL